MPVEEFDPFQAITWDPKKLVGRRRTRSRPRRRSPSVWRCGGRATDDSRQPARRRAAEGPEADRVRRRPAPHARLRPHRRRHGAGHRLVVLVAAAASRRSSTRTSRRRSRSRRGSSRCSARSSSSRRRDAAPAARRADRAAAQRPERSGAAARSRQQERARHAVADDDERRTAQVTIEGRSTTLIALSDFVGNLGSSALLQQANRDRREPGAAGGGTGARRHPS